MGGKGLNKIARLANYAYGASSRFDDKTFLLWRFFGSDVYNAINDYDHCLSLWNQHLLSNPVIEGKSPRSLYTHNLEYILERCVWLFENALLRKVFRVARSRTKIPILRRVSLRQWFEDGLQGGQRGRTAIRSMGRC